MNRQKLFGLLGSVMLLFSSCNFMIETESLLQPPKLTAEQRQINDALAAAIGTRDYQLKYPTSGDHLSAFVFMDLDGDGQDEALVFYQLGGDENYARLKVLRQVGNTWESVSDVAGQASDVQSIQFAPVLSASQPDIIVCWKEQTWGSYVNVSVYTFEENRLETAFSDDGEYLHVVDYNNDGLYELLLVSGSGGGNPNIQLARRLGTRRVISTSRTQLSDRTIDFVNVTVGGLTNRSPAVFIDEAIEPGTIATEVVVIEDARLTNLMDAGGNDLYQQTMRDSAFPSKDIDGDGLVEIPVQTPLPGYSEGMDGDIFYLTTYYKMARNALSTGSHHLVNVLMGYRLDLPDKWLDRVTVVPSADNEWSIVAFDGDLENSTVELLRVRVSSHQDYEDKFVAEEYFLLGIKGMFEYKARLSNQEHELGITAEEAIAMFRLLT